MYFFAVLPRHGAPMPAVDCIVRRDRGGFSRAHRAQFFAPRLVYRYRRSPLWQQYRCSFIAGVAADRGAAGGGRRARSLRDCGWLGGTRRERRDRGRQARRASSPGGVTETAALRTVFSVRQSAALAPRQAVGDDACRPARRVRPRWTGYCWCASLHDVSTLVQREHARGAAPPGSWRRAA